MDLVGEDHHAAGRAEVGQADERRAVPDDAAGVVGIREDEHPALRIDDAFEILEIHLVGAVRPLAQRVADHLAAVALGHQAEGVVDRRLDDNPLVGGEQAVYGHADPLDDAGDVGDPLGADLPAVVRADPVDDRRAVVRRFERIAQHGVFEPPAERVEDEVGGFEIHVGDPQGHEVPAAVGLREAVVLDTVGAVPLDPTVEVVAGRRSLRRRGAEGFFHGGMRFRSRARARHQGSSRTA